MWWKDYQARCSRRIHTLEEVKMLMLMFERAFGCAEALLFEWPTLYGYMVSVGCEQPEKNVAGIIIKYV